MYSKGVDVVIGVVVVVVLVLIGHVECNNAGGCTNACASGEQDVKVNVVKVDVVVVDPMCIANCFSAPSPVLCTVAGCINEVGRQAMSMIGLELVRTCATEWEGCVKKTAVGILHME